MKLDFKNLQGKINPNDLLKKVSCVCAERMTLVLFIVFLVFLGYCGYLWYAYNYSYQWDEAKKQEYMTAKNSGTNFNKAKFEKVLKDIGDRQEEYKKDLDKPKDIFRLK